MSDCQQTETIHRKLHSGLSEAAIPQPQRPPRAAARKLRTGARAPWLLLCASPRLFAETRDRGKFLLRLSLAHRRYPVRYRFAQWHIPLSGAMSVLPSRVKEYSTAMAFDVVTRLAINPVDSRLRRVLVSIRWETLPTWRRNLPVSIRPLFQRKQNLGRAPADKNRRHRFRSLFCLHKVVPPAKVSGWAFFALGTVPPCQRLRARRN